LLRVAPDINAALDFTFEQTGIKASQTFAILVSVITPSINFLKIYFKTLGYKYEKIYVF